MNVFEIVKVIQDKITNTTSKEELIYLAKSLENLNLGQVKTVSTYTDLLNIKYPIEGELYFVDTEERLYYAFGSRWILVFNPANSPAYGWGVNSYGRVGDGTTTSRAAPTLIVGNFTDWTLIGQTRGPHSNGLRADGTIWSWGKNEFSQLGDGTTVSRSSPVSLIGGITDWVYLAGGGYTGHAIRANGTLWSWGRNSTSQLGDGTNTNKSSPVSVVGGFTDWIQVTASASGAGRAFTVALRGNGTLWSWGTNQDGVLGHGAGGVETASPKSVVGGFTDWTKVGTGRYHTVALRSNGTIWCWGRNEYGQLGENGVVGARTSSPVSVIGGFTDWVAISAGHVHSLGIRSNGTLWAWGRNNFGQLGDNTSSNRSSPVSVVGGFTDWTSVSGGGGTSMALRSNGTLWGIGAITGDGTSTNRSSPVSVAGGFTDWVSVTSTGYNSFAIRSIN